MVYKKNKRDAVKENSNRYTREKLCRLLKTTKVRIFKNDPITWIPQNHVSAFKREISWHLYELTHLLNMECWDLIVDIIFKQHSHTLFSLIYQLSNNYLRSTLSILTTQHETYSTMKRIASIYNTNLILYKPNYIPQYLKVNTHYINLITCNNVNSRKTMLVYSQPIECLYSMDYNFQLGSLTDLRYEEQVCTRYFDMSKCLIEFQDFDNCTAETTTEDNMILFKQRFDANVNSPKYKTFVALWCESESSAEIPDVWWPYSDNRTLTIQEFVLLLIKVSTTYSGTGVIIYKSNYYCICGDSYEGDMMMCEVHDDGQLSIPNHFLRSELGNKYKRGSLIDLVTNFKHLYVN